MSKVCEKCGAEHVTPLGFPACKAHTKRGACRANPVRGAAVCSKHGMTGAMRRKAAARVAEAKIERTMGDLLAEHDMPEQNPYAALLDLSRRMSTMTRMIEGIVKEFQAGDEDDDRLQAALALYERFGRLSAQVSKTVLDARLEERLVKLEEAQGQIVLDAIRAAMRRSDLTFVQQDRFGVLIAEELAPYREALPGA